jgi:hypothetical protein
MNNLFELLGGHDDAYIIGEISNFLDREAEYVTEMTLTDDDTNIGWYFVITLYNSEGKSVGFRYNYRTSDKYLANLQAYLIEMIIKKSKNINSISVISSNILPDDYGSIKEISLKYAPIYKMAYLDRLCITSCDPYSTFYKYINTQHLILADFLTSIPDKMIEGLLKNETLEILETNRNIEQLNKYLVEFNSNTRLYKYKLPEKIDDTILVKSSSFR